MGKDLYEASEQVRNLFQLASDVTSMDLKKLLFNGSEEDLKATDKTQIAVTLVNLSASAFLKERGITADGSAGFSLGEYSALWEAGVISDRDIFSIVKVRGKLMEQASRNLDSSDGDAGMAAVLGLTYEDAMEVMDSLTGEEIYLANYSSPIQIVLAGTAKGINRAEEAFLAAEAMKFVKLRVSGPFHSPLLAEARVELEEALKSFTFSDPMKPVYANVSGKKVRTGDEAREMCIQQVVKPVRWVDEEQAILDDGFDRFLETGPGGVLSGLWKSFYKKIRCRKAGTVEDIEKIE
jgi:[acyl-carrier-protein] S-malonyltransferase